MVEPGDSFRVPAMIGPLLVGDQVPVTVANGVGSFGSLKRRLPPERQSADCVSLAFFFVEKER